MAGRSEPGLGRFVGLYLADKTENWRGDSFLGNAPGFTTYCVGVAEDYADCGWPVVVKAQREVSREDLAHHLRDLADAIEGGLFAEVEADRAYPAGGDDAGTSPDGIPF
jgi:hypothetical protein